jgi:hypothetical protein
MLKAETCITGGHMSRVIWRSRIPLILTFGSWSDSVAEKPLNWTGLSERLRKNDLALVGSYLAAATQFNLAVGREVIQ